MRRLNIPHVPYTLTGDGGKPYSLCENFVTTETELIPALHVMHSAKRLDNDSRFTRLLRCCDGLGIPNAASAIDKMLVLDYIISNEDRHLNNFGFLRNAGTLEWLGAAPIFDSGTSLWYNTLTEHIGQYSIVSKPFEITHPEQIKLVGGLDWFNFDALNGLTSECEKILAGSNLINMDRRGVLANVVWERAQQVEQRVMTR